MNSYSGLLAGNLQLSTPQNKFYLFGAYNYVLKSGSNRLRCLQSSDVNFGITGGKTQFAYTIKLLLTYLNSLSTFYDNSLKIQLPSS